MANPLSFWKMNGAGNDFVMVDNRDLKTALTTEQIAALCDRHRGVGADGLLAVEPARGQGDFRMRYYNADGGEAEMCGNGARCFGRFVNRLHEDDLEKVSFETLAGIISAEFEGDQVRINMSDPFDLKGSQPVLLDGQEVPVSSINTGVPHAVVFVDDVEDVNVRSWGSTLRHHDLFSPKGTNVNFVEVKGPDQLRIRTYERGVEDETLACGTGMVACALIHHERTGTPGPIGVRVQGGDTCQVGFNEPDPHNYTDVTLFGPADFVFQGTLDLDALSH